MKEYEVISSGYLEVFSKEVQDALKEGWACQGGLVIIRNVMGDNMYYQAMVK